MKSKIIIASIATLLIVLNHQGHHNVIETIMLLDLTMSMSSWHKEMSLWLKEGNKQRR